LPSVVVSDLEPLHDALVLLLRHFWACMPPQSPQFEQKVRRESDLGKMRPRKD
jgi:hypothetical protein